MNEKGDALGRLVKSIETPKTSSLGSPAPGGASQPVVTLFEYDGDGRLKNSRVVRGLHDDTTGRHLPGDEDRVESWTYGANGLLATHVAPSGLTTEFVTYDGNNRLAQTRTTDAYGDVEILLTTTTYDTFGFVDTVTTADDSGLGGTLSEIDYQFDSSGLLRNVKTKAGDGTVLAESSYEYAADGATTAAIDADGVRSESQFDTAGRLISQTVAVGQTFVAPSLSTTARSIEQKTDYTYYSHGALRAVETPDGTTTTTYADPFSWTTWTTIDGVAAQSTVAGTIAWATTTAAAMTRSNPAGRVWHEKDLLTGAETFYDYMDRRSDAPTETRSSFTIGLSDTFESTLAFLPSTTHRNARGSVEYSQFGTFTPQTLEYDELQTTDNTAIVGDKLNQVQTHVNNPGAASIDLNGRTTSTELDERGRVRVVTDALTGTETGTSPATVGYEYESGQLKVTSTSRTGIQTYQWYDALGRIVKAENELGGVTQYAYNPTGTLQSETFTPADTSAESIVARSTTYTYDALGRVRSTTSGGANDLYGLFSAR